MNFEHKTEIGIKIVIVREKQLEKVFDIVVSDEDRRLIVVSAPGKRFSKDIKVTDLLIATAQAWLKGSEDDDLFQAVRGFDDFLGIDGY